MKYVVSGDARMHYGEIASIVNISTEVSASDEKEAISNALYGYKRRHHADSAEWVSGVQCRVIKRTMGW